MTVIAAIKTKEHVVMGGDSVAVSNDYLYIEKTPKVFRAGPFLIGACGSPRIQQLLRFDKEFASLKPPKRNGFKFMVTKFIPCIRKVVKEGGVTRYKDMIEGMGNLGDNFLVAWGTNLFRIWSDYQVFESRGKYEACGSGEKYALGSIYALINSTFKHVPYTIVHRSLEAAAKHCTSVQGPFTILETRKE